MREIFDSLLSRCYRFCYRFRIGGTSAYTVEGFRGPSCPSEPIIRPSRAEARSQRLAALNVEHSDELSSFPREQLLRITYFLEENASFSINPTQDKPTSPNSPEIPCHLRYTFRPHHRRCQLWSLHFNTDQV